MKNWLILIALIATITTAQTSTIWDGTADTTWFTDNKEATEFTITTAEELAGLAVLVNGSANNGTYNMAGKTIKLGANIMLNDTTGWEFWRNTPPENIWASIGAGASTGGVGDGSYFAGVFDGNGHTIRGLYIEQPIRAGFFGDAQNSVIKNIKIAEAYILSGVSAGGLVGRARNISIINSSYIGRVEGRRQDGTIGGLVGSGSGVSISNSWYIGAVGGMQVVGGLIGSTGGGVNQISQSFFKGNIESYSETTRMMFGGLIGKMLGATIIDSYAIFTFNFVRNTRRDNVIGTIVGVGEPRDFAFTTESKIINSYSAFTHINNATALATGIAGSDVSGNVEVIKSYYQRGCVNDLEGKTSNEMKLKATFADWDFDNIWGIDENINLGYPYLIALKEPVTPTSIKNIKKSDNRYGIRFANNIVSDKAEISVILPNNERIVETKIVVYDMTGNVVASTGSATDGTIVWDLRNRAGRFVANGSYLIIVEAKDRNGRTHIYSARLGVNR